jgi:hypothetical protein
MDALGLKTRMLLGLGSLCWGPWGRYRVGMKFTLLAAILIPAAGAAFGQSFANPAAQASAATSANKEKLLNEIESWRAMHLPHLTPPDELTVRFEPRLDGIKAAAKGAVDADGLAQPLKDFSDWKKELLAQQYAQAKSRGLTHESFANFTREETQEAAFSAALHERLFQDAVKRAVVVTQQRAQTATTDPSRFFDGRGLPPGLHAGGSDVVLASPPSSDPTDPSRYAKVREILLSQIPAGSKARRARMARIIDSAIKEAIRQGADPLLALSVIQNESGFNPSAESAVGARGLMQIMPETGRGLGVRDSDQLWDVQTNLRAGIRFLKSLCSTFSVKSAVAAYNAGAGAVHKYGGVPPYRETQGYVKNVLAYYAKLQSYLA